MTRLLSHIHESSVRSLTSGCDSSTASVLSATVAPWDASLAAFAAAISLAFYWHNNGTPALLTALFAGSLALARRANAVFALGLLLGAALGAATLLAAVGAWLTST